MIAITANDLDRQIGRLVGAFQQLPRNLANKHLKAAVGRAVRPHIKDLRKNTPPEGGGRRGRRKKGEKPRSSGALRRAVAVRTKARKATASAVLGYRASFESRKAIWLEFGTSRGISPREMVKKTFDQVKGQVQKRLPDELRKALEKAAKDVAPPGTGKFRG
jgi:HK97 gp10 family phage protein